MAQVRGGWGLLADWRAKMMGAVVGARGVGSVAVAAVFPRQIDDGCYRRVVMSRAQRGRGAGVTVGAL